MENEKVEETKRQTDEENKRQEEQRKQKEDEEKQKRVAYYTSLINAWIQTKMESDKTLILISSGGIAFLINFLTKEITTITDLIIILAALISFFMVIVFCILIFERNSKLIEALTENTEAKDEWLGTLDKLAKGAFGLALIFTLIIGASNGIENLYKNLNSKGEMKMSDMKKVQNESLKDLGNLNPEKGLEKSLNGLSSLRPEKNTSNKGTTGTNTQATTDNKK